MKTSINKLIAYVEILVAIALGFMGIVSPLPSFLFNILILATAFIILSDALGRIDKANGYGQTNNDQDNQHHHPFGSSGNTEN